MIKQLISFLFVIMVLSCGIEKDLYNNDYFPTQNPPPPSFLTEAVWSGLYTHNIHPQGENPEAFWIDNMKSLLVILDELGVGKQYGLTSTDFSKEGLMLLLMGQKPTSGYAMELIPDQSYISEQTAFIRVSFNKPGSDDIVNQVFTSPYIIIKIPKEDFNRIIVIDQNSLSRAIINL